MKIGDKIKQLREEIDMERAEFAKMIDVTYHALAKYETNERQPDYEILKSIADFFNVSTDYLLGRTNIRNPIDNNANSLEEKSYNIDELSPESKKELQKYIQLLKLKDEMDKTRDEMSSASERNAQ